MKRFCQCLCVITTLFAVGSRRPAMAAPAGPEYKLTIVLDIAKSRAFTEPFRQQVERKLREDLQASLGSLASVDIRSSHPLLADIRARGLGPVLDSWKERSDTKTHFVLIDLVNNKYEIQSRQFDGPTATPSPVVRTARTVDREFVVRTAALLIEQDFGITATFRNWPRAERGAQTQVIQMEFPGAGPGAPLSHWVKPNDIFAVVHTFTNNRAPEVVPWSLVQIQDAPKDDDPTGAATGKLFWRYDPRYLEGPDHAGYRCVKLGAVSAPVRLRFLQQRQDKTVGPLLTPLVIEVGQRGFGEAAGVLNGVSEGGNFSSDRLPGAKPFDRVAFVTVKSGTQNRAYLPLAIVDDLTAVVVLGSTDDKGDALALRVRRWKDQVAVAWGVQTDIFKDLKSMAERADADRQEIVKRAESGLKRTMDDCARLAAAKEELLRDAGKSPPDLKDQELTLQDLNSGVKQLTRYVDKQKENSETESSDKYKTARARIVDAGLAEEKAEYGQAIELYRKAMESIPVDDALRKRVEKLENDWKPKGEAHAKAREFIYEKWPNLDTVGLEREMPNARRALEECQRVADALYPRKLLIATKTHTARLEQENAALKPGNAEDDKKADRIARVSEQLQKLLNDTADYLKKTSAE